MRSTPQSRAIRSLLAVILLFASATGAPAQEKAGGELARNGLAREAEFRIPPQALASAVVKFSEQAAVQLVSQSDDLADLTTRGVSGRLRIEDALQRLLKGTPIEWEVVNGGTIVLRRIGATQTSEVDATDKPSGGVTGRVTQAGEPVAGVTVTATSASLKAPRVVTTAEDGSYHLDRLPPGFYLLRFEIEGLVPVTKKVEVVVGERTSVDVQMSLHEFSDQVVVGSRLGSTPVESALPIKVLDREQIDRSGASTVAQALSLLPEVSVSNNGEAIQASGALGAGSGPTNSTTVQLRGLPRGTTLVLVNGRRVGNSAAFASSRGESFFDLSNIPLSMVERIEVLPYGASAVYGGDGLAGVVNIVLKRDAQGLDVHVRNGMASGYDETQASVTWGQAWSRASLTATASYATSGTLSGSERALTSNADFRRFGGTDLRSAAANPGTVYSLDGCPPPPATCTVPLSQRGNLPGLDAPVAGIPTGQDGQELTSTDFVETAGIQNLATLDSRFFSASEATSIAIQGRYEIDPRLELFGGLLYSKRDVPPHEVFLALATGELGLTRSIVPAQNPFNPFGVDVGVDVVQQTTGIFTDFRPEYLQPQLGVRGGWGDWSWELATSLSKDLTEATLVLLDGEALEAALTSTDPVAALNPFRGDGGALGSQDLMDSLFVRSPRDFRSDLWQVNGLVRGPLAKLPAGRVEALLGIEWEQQELHFQQVSASDPETPSDVSGSDESRAVFGEIRLPLIALPDGRDGARLNSPGELLTLTGAFRMDTSDRFEETGTTETIGLELRPTSSLLFRATHSSAFKPLSMFSAFDSRDLFFDILSVTDPHMGNETFLVDLIVNGGVPPDLKPETSTSRTVGLVWSAESLAGTSLSITAWENRLRNRIAGLSAQFIVDNEDLFPGRVVRDPQTSVITQVDARQGNINFTNIEGVDLGLSWRWRTRYGELSPSLTATWIGAHEEQLTPSSPEQDNLAIWRSTGWSPRWKGTTTLSWEYEDQAHVTLIGRYVSSYQDSEPLETGPAAGTFQSLGDFWMFDLNVDLNVGRWLASRESPLSDTRLNLGAVNLFNRLPDFCNGCNSRGYDWTQYDIRGRFAYAELRFSF